MTLTQNLLNHPPSWDSDASLDPPYLSGITVKVKFPNRLLVCRTFG